MHNVSTLLARKGRLGVTSLQVSLALDTFPTKKRIVGAPIKVMETSCPARAATRGDRRCAWVSVTVQSGDEK